MLKQLFWPDDFVDKVLNSYYALKGFYGNKDVERHLHLYILVQIDSLVKRLVYVRFSL